MEISKIKVSAQHLKTAEDKLQKINSMITDAAERMAYAVSDVAEYLPDEELSEEFADALKSLLSTIDRLDLLTDNIGAIAAYLKEIREQAEAESKNSSPKSE